MSGIRRSRLGLWLTCTMLSILILAAARGDLWLDEIWSLVLARSAHSAGDVFLRFKHDNNHPLNTLFLYLLGDQKHLYMYRLLPVLSGIGSLFLMGHLALKRWGYPEALLSVVLAGTSYPLLLYFSEARGYAPAILCALAAYSLRFGKGQGSLWGRWVAFWLVSALGILSHASFILVLAALAAGDMVVELPRLGSPRDKIRGFLAWHGPPLACFAGWYFWFLREMEIGGGPVNSIWGVVGQALTLLVGLQGLWFGTGLAILVFILVVVLGTTLLYRTRDDSWAFYPALLPIAPACLLVATHPEYFYFRYLIVCFPFFYLLLARLMGEGYRKSSPPWRWSVLAVTGLFLAGEAVGVIQLLRFGRGNYSAALASILAHAPGESVRIASDHDFRNRIMVEFYAPRIKDGNRLAYVVRARWQSERPDWFLTHSQDPAFQPPARIGLGGAGIYQFRDAFPFSGDSGWSWFLYQREIPVKTATP